MLSDSNILTANQLTVIPLKRLFLSIIPDEFLCEVIKRCYETIYCKMFVFLVLSIFATLFKRETGEIGQMRTLLEDKYNEIYKKLESNSNSENQNKNAKSRKKLIDEIGTVTDKELNKKILIADRAIKMLSYPPKARLTLFKAIKTKKVHSTSEESLNSVKRQEVREMLASARDLTLTRIDAANSIQSLQAISLAKSFKEIYKGTTLAQKTSDRK
jgi:hypothetical protein